MASVLSWIVGDVRVTRVVDEPDFPVDPAFLFNLTREDMLKYEWMRPEFVSPEGDLLVSVHTFVLEVGGRRIVVDTCFGNEKPRHIEAWSMRQSGYLQDLTAAGFPPESIDTVVCTHLHVDHVGWNTRLEDGRWVPTFPNAKYLFGRVEYEHWRQQMLEEERLAQAADPDDAGAHMLQVGVVMADSVMPIIDAGLHQLVEVDHSLADEVWLQPTPGHTPGHVSVHIRSKGEEAVITGDMLHHPIQCVHPEMGVHPDWDQKISGETRRKFYGEHADKPVLILGTHFPTPTAGWFVSDGDGWRVKLKH